LRKNKILSSSVSGGQLAENTLSRDLQRQTRRIVIGLGNPILGDDGFGWVVAELIRQTIDQQLASVDIECFALGGLSLMERLIGYDEAILIDAIQLGDSPVGTLQTLPLEDIPDHVVGHLYSSHDTSLKNAIQIGESLGARLPQRITIVGVETSSVYEFSEELSEPVKSAVPAAVQMVLKLLDIKDLSIP
jgi:hydrogenase maturation protease